MDDSGSLLVSVTKTETTPTELQFPVKSFYRTEIAEHIGGYSFS